MASAQLEKLQKELEDASHLTLLADGRVEAAFSPYADQVKRLARGAIASAFSGFEVAAALSAADKPAFAAISGRLSSLCYRAGANAQTFVNESVNTEALFRAAIRDAVMLAGARPGAAKLAADLAAVLGDFRSICAHGPVVKAAIDSVKADRDRWHKARLALEHHLKAHPEENAAAKFGQKDRFSRTRVDVRFGRIMRASDADLAKIASGDFKMATVGPPQFFFIGDQLAGLKTAQEAIARLALEYDWYKGQDLVAPEIRATLSFAKTGRANPTSKAGWLEVLNRTIDWNGRYGQDRAGGQADERVISLPGLEAVQLVRIHRFPWAHGADRKLSAAEVAANKAEQIKLNKAVGARNASTNAGARANATNVDEAYKGIGKWNPAIRRGLTATELAAVDLALESCRSAVVAATHAGDAAAVAELSARQSQLQKRSEEIVQARELKAATVRARGGKRSLDDLHVQVNEAIDEVSQTNDVTSHRQLSVFATTPQGLGRAVKASSAEAVPASALRLAVAGSEKAPVKTAGAQEINQVDVTVRLTGKAGVLESPAAARSGVSLAGGTAGARVAAALPVSSHGHFNDVLSQLVAQNATRMFAATAGKVHTKDSRARGKIAVEAADGSKDALGATFDMAARKPRGEAISSDIARLRQIRTVETKLTGQFDRLEGAVQHARPLVSAQAVQLQASLAKLDAQLAALRGQKGAALADGAREVGITLGEMASVARRMGYRSAGTVQTIQRLVNERRNALARLASGLDPSGAASATDHARLDQLGRQVPGLDKVIGQRTRNDRRQAGRGGSWGGAPRGGLGGRGGKLGASSLAAIGSAARRGDKRGLVDVVAPGSMAQFQAMRTKVQGLFEALRAKGHKPRAKNWFSSAASWVGDQAKKAVTPLAQVAKKAVSGASSLARAVVHNPVTSALSKAVKSGASAVGGLAKATVSAGASLVKNTAHALGSGVKAATSAIGNAAATAYDRSKHAVNAAVHMVGGLAAKTTSALKSGWRNVTGVVGAVGGKIKSGLSSAASWVGDAARKTGGALLHAAKVAGKAYLDYTPMGQLAKLGWKVAGAAYDKTKSLAKAAWSGVKKVGKAVGGFIQSPAGQLLVTGLSMAASFVPGGMLVKAGIGAVMGGIEAFASGGDWKQVLAGAASGGLEGAVPFLKVGGVGKALIGAGKGMLQSAVSGDFSAKGLAKGALGGAWDAGGGKVLGKLGVGGKALVGAGKGALDAALEGKTSLKELATGAMGGAWDSAGAAFLDKVGKAKGARAITALLDGKGNHSGALGKLQKFTQKGAIQKLYAAGRRAAPKVVKGAVWVYDKAGKAHNVLEKVQGGAEHLQSGLAQITELAEWGAGKAGENSALGHWLKKVGGASQWGNEQIGHGLEYVKKVDDVVVRAHGALGKGFDLVGIDAEKEIARMRARQRRQRSHGDLNADVFDRIDNRLHAANQAFMKKSAKARALGTKTRTGALEKVEALQRKASELQNRFVSSKWGSKIIAGGEKLVNAGVWAHGQMQALNQAIGTLTVHGEAIRRGLQDAVLMTEGADPDALGGSLAWIHKTAAEWEQKVGEGLAFVEKVGGYTGAGQEHLGHGLSKIGVEQERLDASGQRAKVYHGLEKGEGVVAPWVLAHEKLEKAASGAISDKAKAKSKAALESLEKWRQRTKTGAEWVSKFGHAMNGEDDPKGGKLGRFDAAGRLILGAGTGDRAADWEAFLSRQKSTETAAVPGTDTKKPAPTDLVRDVAHGLGSKFEQKASEQARDVEKIEGEADTKAADAHGKAVDDQLSDTAAPAVDEAPSENDALPENGLAAMADEEGVVGAPASAAAPALPLVVGAEGAEDDILFQRVRYYLDAFSSKVDALMPQLETLLGTDPAAAEAVFDELVRAGRMPESEIERLGNVVGADPYLGKGLAVLASRLAEIRGRIRPPASDEADGRGAEGEAVEPEASANEGAPEAAGEPVSAETPGLDVAAGAPGDAAYLGESHEDTWIGSGGAARPIAEALATNFQFGDHDAEDVTVSGALGGLGAALSGLGESLEGAAGDVAGLGGTIGDASGGLGGLGGSVSELVGARENPLAAIASKGGAFGQWLQQGAKSVGGAGQKVSAAGGKISAVGHLFRKGKSGGIDEGPAPVVDADDYADAPQRLDYGVMGQMERFLGSRFGDVKIHTGKGADLITKRFDAEAVTIREHIFFAPGRFSPHSTDGRKLLAHELTHVAQRGRANLDTRTAESEAHKAEAAFGTPGMEILDLSQPEADFRIDMGGADQGPAKGPRTAKKDRSVSAGSGAHDEGVMGEELLDRVGERVYELMLDDLENEFESR